MSVAGPVWVLSPHLLVAQAVTAALTSNGVPAETRLWESVVAEEGVRAPAGPRPAVAVVIVDGLDNSTVVGHVEALTRHGGTRVVVVCAEDRSSQWGGLLANEAVDVVTVTTSVSRLADVVERLTQGSSSMDPEQRAALRASWALDRDRRQNVRRQLDSLSPRQRRVLELLASGRRVAEVGVEMGVAEGTVRSHVKSLRAKLGVSTQLKAVALFHEAHGVLIEPLGPTEQEPDVPPRTDGPADTAAKQSDADLVPSPRRGSGDRAPPVRDLVRR